MSLTRADLNWATCTMPGCAVSHDDDELVIAGQCHPVGGTIVTYNKQTGDLTLKCYECARFIGEIQVASP
jgi:hydroxypyruvate isomerase